MKQEWEKRVQRDNTSRGKQTGSSIEGWQIKVRPGKGRANDMRNLLPANRSNFRTNTWRETFCFLAGTLWQSKKKKKPVMLYVLKLLPWGFFEVPQWERKRLERMGLRLETCVMSLFIHVFSSGTVLLCGAKAHQNYAEWERTGFSLFLTNHVYFRVSVLLCREYA